MSRFSEKRNHAVRLISAVIVGACAVAIPAGSEETQFNDHVVEINNDRGVPKVVKLISPVYQSTGSAGQIIQKAQGCVAQHLSNDEVATSGSSASGFFGSIAMAGTSCLRRSWRAHPVSRSTSLPSGALSSRWACGTPSFAAALIHRVQMYRTATWRMAKAASSWRTATPQSAGQAGS